MTTELDSSKLTVQANGEYKLMLVSAEFLKKLRVYNVCHTNVSKTCLQNKCNFEIREVILIQQT